ncbi:MAG: DUF4905 domain-containing protein [Ignavibacteriales bacterium]|nr:DUF4905 domain-containing protein [Ignavibacteriales bacterium]
MKKHFSYKSPRQIWRILISDSDKLILETRDTNTKEVYLHCYDLESGRIIFSDLQLEEKFWLGIEAVYKDIILFHKFPKPDLPGHKQIIAFDIASQKILWTNSDLSFLFVEDNLVYGFQQGFEERYFFSLDYLNGELIKDFGNDYKTINDLRRKAEDEKDWSNYIYPKIINKDEDDPRILGAINTQTKNLAIEGEVEYNFRSDLLFFNFHSKVFEGSYINKFLAMNLNDEQIILNEVLNANASALFTDSFFVYKNFLFLLREKNEVLVFEID